MPSFDQYLNMLSEWVGGADLIKFRSELFAMYSLGVPIVRVPWFLEDVSANQEGAA